MISRKTALLARGLSSAAQAEAFAIAGASAIAGGN